MSMRDDFCSDGGVRRADAKPGGRSVCRGVPGAARWTAWPDEAALAAAAAEDEPERAGDGGEGGDEGVVEKDDPSVRARRTGAVV